MSKSGTKSEVLPRSSNRLRSIASFFPRKLSSRDASPDTVSLPYIKRDSNKFSSVFSKVAGKSSPASIIRSSLSRTSSSSSLGYVAWDYGPESEIEGSTVESTSKNMHTVDQDANSPLKRNNSLLKKFSWRSKSSSEKSPATNTDEFGSPDSQPNSRPASPKASPIDTVPSTPKELI